MLEDELQHVVWLSQKPDIGAVYGRRARSVVGLLYMSKSESQVYYRVNRKRRTVEILALCDARNLMIVVSSKSVTTSGRMVTPGYQRPGLGRFRAFFARRARWAPMTSYLNTPEPS
jgi:hypothetical protein